MAILPNLQRPSDLRALDDAQLTQLCAEIRTTIIDTVAVTGGHLGSSLGVVELTVTLHRLLDSPNDKIVWDTGHQAYPHKLLTGRYARFGTLRSVGGIGGFPRRNESPHDVFDGGHAGTGLSIGEGLALARDERGSSERIAVVVGDAAIFSGLSAEALNDIGHRASRLLIILNDNEMSISPSVGALSRYLSRIKLSGTWRDSKRAYDRTVERIPVVGHSILDVSRRLRGAVVDFAQHGQLFEDLGITYIGPVPGHDLQALAAVISRALEHEGPVLVHVRTQKGKGYRPAEADQVGFHGAALPPMAAPVNGTGGDGEATPSAAQAAVAARRPPNFTAVVAAELVAIAEQDERVVAITAGMPTGTGLSQFGARFPDRMFDVGIAEQHAVTLATGLAMGGLRPFVAIYSTSSSAPSTRSSTTPARTTSRWSSASTGRASWARTARAIRACSRCRRSARSRTSSSPRPRTSRRRAGCCARPSARTIPSRSTTRAMQATTCPRSSRRRSRSGRRRSCARARTCSSSASGRS